MVTITFDRSTSLYESAHKVRHYKRTKERNRKERGKKKKRGKMRKRERERGGGGREKDGKVELKVER